MRSFTHPYLIELQGNVRILSDAPRKSGEERGQELVICTDSVEEAVQALVEHRRKRRAHCVICSGTESNSILVREVKSAGFRLHGTEPMFLRDVESIPNPVSPATVRRVTTSEDTARLAKIARSRQILESHLTADPAPVRSYIAEIDGEIVGWVRSIHLHPDFAYPSNLMVPVQHRRKGIGSALMCEMLRDDARHGVKQSVLLASHAGAKLYPSLGYQRVGTLHLFS